MKVAHFVIAVCVVVCAFCIAADAAKSAAGPVPFPSLINQRQLDHVEIGGAQPTAIRLQRQWVDPLSPSLNALGQEALGPARRQAQDTLRIVQLSAPFDAAMGEALKREGLRVVGTIPNGALIVAVPESRVDAVRMLDGVRWMGSYAPEYRLTERTLRARDSLAMLRGPDAIITIRAAFMPDVDADYLAAALSGFGEVLSLETLPGETIVDLNLPVSRLDDLATREWLIIAETVGPNELHNNLAADIVDARNMWVARGFYGSNEIIAVADSGLDIGVTNSAVHRDFQDGAGHTRVLAAQDFLGDGTSDPFSGHGTHVAGSVLGNGHLSGSNPTNNSFPAGAYAGMAPKAWLVFQAIGSNNAAVASSVYPPADLNALYQPAYTAGARIHQNSWGMNTFGDYSHVNARNTDLFCFNHPQMLICYSAGNAGVDAAVPSGVVDPGSVGLPGVAKNVLTVGATENNRPSETLTWGSGWPANFPNAPINADRVANNTNGMAAFSSRGPCSDGRIKPEIVAPGTFIASCKTHASTASLLWGDVPGNTNYAYSGGTSMSCPLVSGVAATFREYLRVNRGLMNPPAALLKAGLLCGAFDIAPGQYGGGATQEVYPAPNSVEGWGRLTLEDALYKGLNYEMLFWTNAFGGPNSVSTTVTLYDTSYPFKAILAWTDMPGSLLALNETYAWIGGGGLMNDLDLRVIDPLGRTNYPQAMNTRLDLFYYTNTSAQFYNSPVGMFEAEKCTAPAAPLTITRIYQVLYDTSGAGGSYGTYIWNPGAGGMPGTTLMAFTGTVAASGVGFKYRVLTISPGVTITGSTFFIGSQLLSANLCQLRDGGIGSAGSPRTYSTYSGPWTYDNDPDMWIHAYGTVSTGDHINTVEGVVINNPTGGTYRIIVSGVNVPYTPVHWGVAYSGGFVPEPFGALAVGALALLLARRRAMP